MRLPALKLLLLTTTLLAQDENQFSNVDVNAIELVEQRSPSLPLIPVEQHRALPAAVDRLIQLLNHALRNNQLEVLSSTCNKLHEQAAISCNESPDSETQQDELFIYWITRYLFFRIFTGMAYPAPLQQRACIIQHMPESNRYLKQHKLFLQAFFLGTKRNQLQTVGQVSHQTLLYAAALVALTNTQQHSLVPAIAKNLQSPYADLLITSYNNFALIDHAGIELFTNASPVGRKHLLRAIANNYHFYSACTPGSQRLLSALKSRTEFAQYRENSAQDPQSPARTIIQNLIREEPL